MKYKKITIFILTFTVLFSSMSILGDTISNLENEKDKIQNDIEQAEKELEEIRQQISSAETELSSLDLELSRAEKEYNYIAEQLEQAELELVTAEAELEEAIQTKEEQYIVLKDRLAYMYEYGSVSYIEVMLGSNSIYDLFNRVEYVTRVAEHDKNLLKEYEEQERIIEEKVKEIERKKLEIEKLYKEAEIKKDNLQRQYEEKVLLISNMESDVDEQMKLVNELEQADKDIEQKILEEQKKAEEALQNSGGSDVIYTGGQMGWPVPGYSNISSGFVDRLNPVTGVPEKHKGVDIPAPTGTPIVAAESGVVIDSRYINGYGYTVIISHGNGVSTLYGHNSQLLVNVGDMVSRGDAIALAGSTGNSTGPHCHFEVRINGVATNPMPYL